MHPILLDAADHRRQPVTLPGYHAGRPPRNKGRRYPADPPTVEEIIAVMRAARRGAGPPREGRQASRGRDGQLGVGAARALAPSPRPVRGRPAVLRDPRLHRRTQLGSGGRAPQAGPDRRRGRGQTPVRASSTPPRARDRAGSRGRPTARYPAPTCQPRNHVDLPPRDRRQRDHPVARRIQLRRDQSRNARRSARRLGRDRPSHSPAKPRRCPPGRTARGDHGQSRTRRRSHPRATLGGQTGHHRAIRRVGRSAEIARAESPRQSRGLSFSYRRRQL
jgi:hypothetical protein